MECWPLFENSSGKWEGREHLVLSGICQIGQGQDLQNFSSGTLKCLGTAEKNFSYFGPLGQHSFSDGLFHT
jgi:hypothetical protein